MTPPNRLSGRSNGITMDYTCSQPMKKQLPPTGPEPSGPAKSDPQDMGHLYGEIRKSLMRFATRYFRRPQEIEDVVQDAFVKVIEAQHKRDIESPKAYLYRTTRNLALNQLDRSAFKLTDALSDVLLDSEPMQTLSLEDQFESQQKFELFCRAVRQLPLKCQRVYILRRVYGFSQKEVSERMGISIKTVEAHLTKAIIRCTDYMDEDHAANEVSATGGRDNV